MATINDELDRLGKSIVNDARRLALPNKKTGALDRSFSYDYTYMNSNKFTVIISELHYGKYLNNKTKFMDKAISQNIKNIDPIIDVMIDEMLDKIINK